MAQVFVGREERDVERLESVVAFLDCEECLTVRLLAYSGEIDAERCGKCSSCLKIGRKLLERSYPELSLEDLELMQTVLAERQAALRAPRQVARFFCGIASPASAGGGLKRHRAFGIFAEMPFLEVLTVIEALGKHRI